MKKRTLLSALAISSILALVLEFTFAWLGRVIVSPGLRRTASKSSSPISTTVLEPATT